VTSHQQIEIAVAFNRSLNLALSKWQLFFAGGTILTQLEI